MARAGTYSALGTTQTAYFVADRDRRSPLGGTPAGTLSGIGTGGDGVPVRGFYVTASSTNTTNVNVYVNGLIAGVLEPGTYREWVTIDNNRTANGVRLEMKAASGTVAGTFGNIG